MEDQHWKVNHRQSVFARPPWVEIFEEEITLPNGDVIPAYYEIKMHNFASVFAITDEGKVLVLKQYRHGVRRVGYLLPGGGIEDGESPLAGGQRELLEETGYTGGTWSALGAYPVSAVRHCGTGNFFLAEGVKYQQAADSGDLEGGEVVALTLNEVREALRAHEFPSVGAVCTVTLALFYLESKG